MTMQFGVSLPQGWVMDLVGMKDPVEAYETMTHIAQTADETGFVSVWLVDHFHTIPQPSQEVTFEAWTTTAALARDTNACRWSDGHLQRYRIRPAGENGQHG